MKRLAFLTTIVLCASLGFVAASCGGGDGAVAVEPVPSGEEAPASGGAEESGSATASTPTGTGDSASETVETPPATGVVTYQVWFHRGEHLFVTTRSQNATPAVGRAAVEALLEGPADHEGRGQIRTQIPTGTQLLGLDIDDGVATVDLTSEFESGGGSASMTMRLAQVVYTLTQFPTVRSVQFMLDSEPVDVFSGEGIVLDDPVSRRDYVDLLPPILVTAPPIGDLVENPVTITGTANVFEANVTVRILNQAREEIARTFTTATCGTGCRGRFSATVPYPSPGEPEAGWIVLSDDDADGDGKPSYEVRIPVILSP